jgi:hypothetical protein
MAIDEGGPSISFHLQAYSPSDVAFRGLEKVQEQRDRVKNFGNRRELSEHRYNHSSLRVLRVDELPEVARISDFRAEGLGCERHIEGSSLGAIAAR